MKTLSTILASAIVFALTTNSAEAAKKKKPAEAVNGDFAGTVVSVTKGEGTESPTSVTVKIAGGKKKAPATEKKFDLAKDVKLESLMVSKKAFAIKSATIDNLKAGERVILQTKEGKSDQADRVLVVAASAKKKTVTAN